MADKLKTLIYLIVNCFYSVPYRLFCLFPIVNNRILVYGFLNQGISDHPKYIVRELLKENATLEVIWISNVNDCDNTNRIKIVPPKTLKAMFYQATSHIWIASVRMPYYVEKRKQQFYVQTWHGTLNIKKIEGECEDSLTKRYILMAKHDSSMVDLIACPNKDQVDLFKKYYWYDGNGIVNVGSARNDILYNIKENEIELLKKKYGYEDKHIILYAPTFRADRSLNSYNLDFERIRREAEKRYGGDWILLVRLHPTMFEKAKDIVDYNSFIRDGSIVKDTQELLAMADILITDYSSIIFDFMVTYKPALIYAPDIDAYTKERDFHIDLKNTPFIITQNQDELIKEIINFEEASYHHRIDIFNSKYGIKNDGLASKRIATLIHKRILINNKRT